MVKQSLLKPMNMKRDKHNMPARMLRVAVFSCICLVLAYGSAAGEPAAEKQLLSLINQARSNPLLMAEMAGMDTTTVIGCFRDRREILEYGLRPLDSNQKLVDTASAHTAEMLEHNYYDRVSIDGRRPVERIADAGYKPLVTGENIGIIGFNNFMNREQAVWELFKNMYRDELACGKDGPWQILNPGFSEIGVSVRAGTMNFNGGPTNIYMATCDFGTSEKGMFAAERRLLQLINEVRANPAAALSYAGIDFASAYEALGRNGWILILGLPPLAANEDFFAYADKRIDHFAAILRERGLEFSASRVDDARDALYDALAYEAQAAVESLVANDFNGRNPSPDEGALDTLVQMLKTEFENAAAGKPLVILNPGYTEMGIAYRHVKTLGAGGADKFYGMLSCVLAEPGKTRRHIVGRISWADPDEPAGDGDGAAQEVIESVNGLLVRLESVPVGDQERSLANVCFSDPAGGYSVRLPEAENNSGEYRLTVSRLGVNQDRVLHSEAFSYYHNRNLLRNIQLQRSGPQN